MKHVRKPMAILLTVILLVQLVSGIIPAMAVSSTAELTDHSFHGEGLWLTEIYPNDAERSKTADTRPADGCIPVTTFDSASDLMEFIEVISTHDEDFKLNDVYQIYANTNLQYITTMSGSSDITVKKGQPIVIWNERTDVRDNDGIILPTEAQIRKDLRIPDNALLLKASTGKGWDNVSTFTIKVKATGETLCTFTPTANVHVKDGLSCELKMPFWKSETTMEVYQPMNLPSPGYVYHDQVRGYIKSIVPEGYDGKGVFISEIRPNDVNRNSSSTSFPTLTNFRNAYGIASSVPVYIFVNQSSLNDTMRGLELFSVDANGNPDEKVSGYFYHGDTDVINDTSAQLKVRHDGPGMALYEACGTSTMGTVAADQTQYIADTGLGVEMRLHNGVTIPEYIMQGEDLRINFYYEFDSRLSRLDTSVYYRFDGTGSWYRQTEGGIRIPNMYESVLPANELFDHDYVEFYITSTNPYRTTAKVKAASNGVASALDVDALKMTVDFDTTKQSISEKSFSAYLATNEELGTVAVSDGTATLDVTDLTSEEDHYWYADLNNADSGYLRTGVYEFTTTATPNFYLFGYINGADYACEGDAANMGEYMFDANGKLTAIFKQDSYKQVSTQAPTCEAAGATNYRCSACGSTYADVIPATGHSYNAKVTAPTCTAKGYTTYTCACGDSYTANEIPALGHNYTSEITTAPGCTAAGVRTYSCSVCGNQYTESVPATGHSYVNGSCTTCGAADPDYVTSYYLIGYINGADYGCEGDYQNMGSYKFVNGKLTATFTQDSYVFLKTEGNANWYMTQSYSEDTSAVFYNTNTGTAEKLFVPGNVEITFTLMENADGSLTLSYVKAASVKPTLKLKAPTLEFKDMITVNAFFTAENIQDVVEMGMITYSYKSDVVSVETAEHRIPGAAYIESSGRYLATSQGIHAKYLGDTVYLAVYAELKDGSFVYTILAPYSPVDYATNQIKNSTNMQLKQLCAAMLNYGAEAQLFFGHNTSALANASLTDEQKALPEAYRADMVAAVPAASAAKQGAFANNKGFAKRTPSISFEGAFCINYFFTPNYAPVDGITMYYWNEADFNAASVMTTANATGSFKMNGSGVGQYNGSIEGIAAKALSEAVYVAAVYSDGTNTWTSGVLGYSIGSYCSSQASKGAAVSNLAMATAVYGYQAKQYFG